MSSNDKNITWHHSGVSREARQSAFGHKGATIWLTGLSGSGKSTIAVELEKVLFQKGIKAYILDGDNIRFGLNKDLGFSASDRTENIRRISEVCRLFADANIVCIACFISPYVADRDQARAIHVESGLDFVEVFVDSSIEVAESRDPKGLYQKARQGLIKEFTGISAPYEEPVKPEIHLDTGDLAVNESVDNIVEYLTLKKII
ncbi:Adenylyl-sulfate kinase [Smittium mucronatum]|uniref:Adenylyl-sulfate kinase n=1 Tax=Smittium mucronatum TaxID=133383 RepID=A0A1R0H0S9_9FUNG|nr:Adenylyl-sulfate kinase [Smittium mucronatum]